MMAYFNDMFWPICIVGFIVMIYGLVRTIQQESEEQE